MKRYDLDSDAGSCVVERPDGEYILYADHCEAMKRIAGDSARQAEPVLHQVRMRPTWREEGKGWTPWEECTAESAQDHERNPVVHDWQSEVRRLYAAPAPASPAAPNPACSVFEDMLQTLEYTEAVYRLNVVKDSGEPSSTLENLQRVIARAKSPSPAALTDEPGLLEYVLQDDLHNRTTPRVIDIAYTAFMAAKQPNTEDGGPSDWFTDTRPVVLAAIEKLRKDLLAASPATPAPSALTDERVFELVGEVLGQPLIVEDLRQGFAVHTEPRDWLNFARALLAASPAALTFAYGVEAAAKWVEQRRANFDAEHGSLDPSTGTMEYGQGAHAQAKLEYAYELVEIEEGIRGILAQAASAIQRCVTCGGAKIDADPLRTGTCDCPAPASPTDHPGDKQ